ncbi:hypothetical protein [Aliterella atlantica]|uniref:Uncharacterized protein n=1 Tax=Aliterella atlantica CENA595 TaxID=1618023 RepID=A0A0D8ZKY7_9CYAN|nr:hypothetical protein [Aliterella atlantica]KJH69395.1 hypothetical protein UH38_24130 [Aliterella atlantica CENA595]
MVRIRKLKKEPGVNITFDLEEPEGLPWNEAPEGLTPIGDTGLYATPSEPADPRDCDRYPDSIYCGNPFTPSFASIEPSFILDKCNVGVQFDGAFGFIKVPPVAIVWRLPECRNPPPSKPIPIPPGTDSPVPFPPHNCQDTSTSIIVIYKAFQADIEEWNNRYPNSISGVNIGRHYARSVITRSVTNIEFPYTGTIGQYRDANGILRTTYSARVDFTTTFNFTYNQNWADAFRGGDISQQGEVTINNYFLMPNTAYRESDNQTRGEIYQTSIIQFKNELENYRNTSTAQPHTDMHGVPDGTMQETVVYGVAVKCGRTSNNNNPPPPRKVSPPPKHCCMTCCPTNNNNDELIRLLIAKIDKLSNTVGVDEYPASLPASLISKDEGFLGNLIPNQNKEIPNLTQFLAWYVERFDEVLGQWEIPIEIKDSDPSKPGDQPLGVKLPNMAEAIGEMFTLAFQTNLNTETLLNFAVRSAAEGITDKQQNFITYKLLQSLTEWAGYKQKDIKVKMPLLFTLGKTRYDEILKESEIDVAVTDFDEKFGLEADLIRFREAASILAANYKRKVNPNGDIKAQILKHLLDAYSAVNKVNKDEDDNDWDDFVKQVEEGFKNVPGVTNPDKPYGRDYSQRPKIRDLTKLDPPTEQP